MLVPAEPCSFSLPHILTSKHKTAANGIFPIPDPAKVTCSFVSTEIRSEDPLGPFGVLGAFTINGVMSVFSMLDNVSGCGVDSSLIVFKWFFCDDVVTAATVV